MAVDKFRIHFFYLSEKRLFLKACVFSGKQMAFVYLTFFDDGTAFPYLPVLPRDFLFGADTLSSFVKEHAAGSNLHIRFGEQPPLASTTMNIYAHSTREAKRTSARLLDKVVGGE